MGRRSKSTRTTLFNQWGIGNRQNNNGVLFLIAPNERRMRIETGLGIEPLLPDSLCGEIADRARRPAFQAAGLCRRHQRRRKRARSSNSFRSGRRARRSKFRPGPRSHGAIPCGLCQLRRRVRRRRAVRRWRDRHVEAHLFDGRIHGYLRDRRQHRCNRRISVMANPATRAVIWLVRRRDLGDRGRVGLQLDEVPPLRPTRLFKVWHATSSCSASKRKTPNFRRSNNWKRKSARSTTTSGFARLA